MDGLEDGALVTDVARGGQTKTTNKASAHIRQDVPVQVGHDENLVVVWNGIGDHLQAGVVEELGVKLNVRELLGNFTSSAQEETVGHLHDGGLVNGADLVSADVASVLECVAQHALRRVTGDELDALDDAIDDNVLNARVLALGVLTDQNRVHVVVGCLVAGDGSTGA